MDSHRNWQPALDPGDLAKFFIARANAGDIDGLVALYQADAILIGPDRQPIVGAEAIHNFYAELLKDRPTFQAGLQSPAIRHGDIALTSSRLTNGDITAEVAHQQPDGSWLWIIDQPAINN